MTDSVEWNYAVVPSAADDVGWGPFGTREHAEMWATCNLAGMEYTILRLTQLVPRSESREGDGQ